MFPTLLALDTSTVACSAALLHNNSVIERFITEPRQHAKCLLPFIESLLQEAHSDLSQCDAIAFGEGPGSFTGIRIAISVAQGLAFGSGKPVIPVSSLHILAQSVYRLHQAESGYVAVDARMEEVYFAHYRLDKNTGLMQAVIQDCLLRPEEIPSSDDSTLHLAGDGWGVYLLLKEKAKQFPADRLHFDVFPHAHDLALLAANLFLQGKVIDPQQASPVYLRDKVTHQPG